MSQPLTDELEEMCEILKSTSAYAAPNGRYRSMIDGSDTVEGQPRVFSRIGIVYLLCNTTLFDKKGTSLDPHFFDILDMKSNPTAELSKLFGTISNIFDTIDHSSCNSNVMALNNNITLDKDKSDERPDDLRSIDEIIRLVRESVHNPPANETQKRALLEKLKTAVNSCRMRKHGPQSIKSPLWLFGILNRIFVLQGLVKLTETEIQVQCQKAFDKVPYLFSWYTAAVYLPMLLFCLENVNEVPIVRAILDLIVSWSRKIPLFVDKLTAIGESGYERLEEIFATYWYHISVTEATKVKKENIDVLVKFFTAIRCPDMGGAKKKVFYNRVISCAKKMFPEYVAWYSRIASGSAFPDAPTHKIE